MLRYFIVFRGCGRCGRDARMPGRACAGLSAGRAGWRQPGKRQMCGCRACSGQEWTAWAAQLRNDEAWAEAWAEAKQAVQKRLTMRRKVGGLAGRSGSPAHRWFERPCGRPNPA